MAAGSKRHHGNHKSTFKSPKGLSKEELAALEREFFHTKTKDIVTKFMETTTAHGWGRVALEKTTVIKLLWVVLTLSAFACNVVHVLALVMQYLRYPTEQRSEVEMSAIEFPSVSFCNIQPMSTSTGLRLLQDPTSRLYQWNNLTQWYYDRAMEDGELSYEEELAYNRIRQPIGYFENLGDEAVTLGHQPLDFVISCTFGISKCTWDNVTFFQSPTYFNCFTFNGGNVSQETLVARTTGPQAGLSLILYLENDNGDQLYNGTYHTLSNVGNAAGARVIVHPPNTRPTPVDHGFDVPPGFSSSVGVKVTRYDRLGDPYGACMSDRMYGSDQYIYSIDTCVTTCQQRHVMDRCGCKSAMLPVPPVNMENCRPDCDVTTNKCGCVSSMLPVPEYNESRLKYCGSFDPAHQEYFFRNLTCEAETLAEFISQENTTSACGCIPPCAEQTYSTAVSYSYWPLDFTQLSFYEAYVRRHPQRDQLKAFTNLAGVQPAEELVTRGLIRKNFLRLNVYMKDLIIQEYIQKSSYEIQNLLGDMGGTFGLWIGMSLITWCEVVELVIRITSRAARKLTKSGEMDTSSREGSQRSPAQTRNSPEHRSPSDNRVNPAVDKDTLDALGFRDYSVSREVQV